MVHTCGCENASQGWCFKQRGGEGGGSLQGEEQKEWPSVYCKYKKGVDVLLSGKAHAHSAYVLQAEAQHQVSTVQTSH